MNDANPYGTPSAPETHNGPGPAFVPIAAAFQTTIGDLTAGASGRLRTALRIRLLAASIGFLVIAAEEFLYWTVTHSSLAGRWLFLFVGRGQILAKVGILLSGILFLGSHSVTLTCTVGYLLSAGGLVILHFIPVVLYSLLAKSTTYVTWIGPVRWYRFQGQVILLF